MESSRSGWRRLYGCPAGRSAGGHGVPGADPGVYRYGAYAEESFDQGGKAGETEGEPGGDRGDPEGNSYGTYVVSVVDGREVNGAAAMDFMSEV